MHVRHWLALGLMLVQVWALAQTTEPLPPLSLEDARAQRVRGKALKAEAEARYEAEKAECQAPVIAVGCMSSAKDRRTATVREADTLERGGRKAEREAHQGEIEAKATKRAAEAPGREAKQQADVERHREKEAQRVAERERRQSEDAAKLEARRGKAAAERAAKQRKIEARQQEDAARAARAPEKAKKRAERERRHAERVRKIDERAQRYAETLKRRAAAQPAGTPAR